LRCEIKKSDTAGLLKRKIPLHFLPRGGERTGKVGTLPKREAAW